MAGEFFDYLNRLGTETGTGTYGAELPTGSNVERFKVLFGAEILANFKAALVFGRATRIKSIDQGKGWEFNLLAEMGAAYHYPGDVLSGQQVARGTRQIFLDGILTSSVYVHRLDELLNHTDERTRYASEMGYALSKTYDKAIAAEIIRGALVAPVPGIEADVARGGTIVEADISGATDKAIALYQAILTLGNELDKKNVPESGRRLILKPDYYWILFENLDLINTLHPGIGSIAEGNVLRIAGFTIEKSNNFPTSSADVKYHEIPAAYQANGTTASQYANIPTNASIGGQTLTYRKFNKEDDVAKVAGVFYTNDAVVTLKRKGLTVETQEYLDKMATLIVASMLVGHGWLKPIACGMVIDTPSSVIV